MSKNKKQTKYVWTIARYNKAGWAGDFNFAFSSKEKAVYAVEIFLAKNPKFEFKVSKLELL